QELKRVLRPGGKLFLSVPFGTYQNFGSFQQFDLAHLDEAINAFQPLTVTTTFYRYNANGWQLSTAVECQDCRYVEWVAQSFVSDCPSQPNLEADQAAAARAVACIQLINTTS
ncbi:MAG: hypothetical protein ACO3AY_08380, partial [Chitinophagaceae bacterium]